MKNSEWINLEKFEQLMQSKPYAELNHEEKEWVSQWVESSDEYEMLRKSETKIRQYFLDNQVNPPASTTLAQLTMHLKRKPGKQHAGLWWQFKPSLSAWSMAILFGSVGWWIGQSTNSNIAKAEALRSPIVLDTIYIASQPDTVFREKVIYRDRPVILTRRSNDIESSKKSTESNGINMKEKEELEKLLVSGTD
jgi:hypothetical protein